MARSAISPARRFSIKTVAIVTGFIVLCYVSCAVGQTESNIKDLESHDGVEKSHDDVDKSHDHGGGESHDHGGESHDHAGESHDHGAESHDHTSESHDHGAESHDHPVSDQSESHDLSVDESHGNVLDTGVAETGKQLSEAEVFIKELFSKYGDKGVMTFEGFEHLLENIGLAQIKIRDHNIKDHHTDVGFKEFHGSHNHTVSEEGEEEDKHVHHDHDHDHTGHSSQDDRQVKEDKGRETTSAPKEGKRRRKNRRKNVSEDEREMGVATETTMSPTFDPVPTTPSSRVKRAMEEKPPHKCMSPQELLELYHIPSQQGITQTDFLQLCPSIVYQMDQHVCKDHHDHNHDHHDNHTISTVKMGFMNIKAKVWGYAVLSVTVISLVGLLSVAIIPVMQKVFYNHLIQFLVALAVGSLTGDAALHLIPHAMVPHVDSGDHSHEEVGGHGHDHSAVWKGMMVLVGIYTFFIMERLMSMLTEWRRKRPATKCKHKRPCHPVKSKKELEKTIGSKLSQHEDYHSSCQDFIMVVHGKGVKQLAEDCAAGHEEELKELADICEEESSLNTSSQMEQHGHGHGHSHGPMPTSISSVAWMVIMGDGLHNFSDGLAIGASFANGITGGLSTAVAVFCHELPHELGDFAVLLRAGMPVRQALFYNIVSSVLCFLGMGLGVVLGNIQEASLWIFAVTGGMFIYISLVDMLPELTSVSPRPGEGQCCHLVLQCLGITVGVTIMLLIALFEDKIAFSLGDKGLS